MPNGKIEPFRKGLAPNLTVSNLGSIRRDSNEYGDSSSQVSSVSISVDNSADHTSVYSKRNCNGMYQILENIRSSSVDGRKSGELVPIQQTYQTQAQKLKFNSTKSGRSGSINSNHSNTVPKSSKKRVINAYKIDKPKAPHVINVQKVSPFRTMGKTQAKLMQFL